MRGVMALRKILPSSRWPGSLSPAESAAGSHDFDPVSNPGGACVLSCVFLFRHPRGDNLCRAGR